MKKVASALLVLTMVIFLIDPLSSEARGGYSGGGHGGSGGGGHWSGGGGHGSSGDSGSMGSSHYYGGYHGGYYGGYYGGGGWWPWWPWTVIGGAALLAPYYYWPYYEPYYAPPPAIIQEQPPLNVQQAASATERIFVYPRLGQSEELQAKDRSECHSWALSQTWREPRKVSMEEWTIIIRSLPETQRAEYRRAESACLEGRGYTVR
jgi:hypothetical protein